MKAYGRFSTAGQMAGSVGVFLALALALESGGLLQWAQRLEVGPERTAVLPLARGLQWACAWTGVERMRQQELMTLARVGWSDDPLALAKAAPVATPPVARPAFEAKPVNATTTPVSPAAAVHTPPTPLRPMAGDPPLLTALPSIAAVPAGKVRTVVLAGDSMMAVGLSSTLLREAPKYKDLTLVRAFKSGTGLARPEVFDWQSEYPAMLRAAKPDIVVVAIGANDGQGFVEDGKVYPFGSEEWKAIYERRVQAFLDMLESGGATVVWVGLPPMKSESYDARIALVNRIDYAVVSASPHAVWFSTAGLVGDADGHFQDFGQVRGATARLRQADGIHLSDDGAALLTAKLLPWLSRQAPPPAEPNVKDVAVTDVQATEGRQ